MKRFALHVAVVAGSSVFLAIAGSARADFTLNATKADVGDKDVVSLYFFNTGTHNTGTKLQAYEFAYAGAPVQFHWVPLTAGSSSGSVDLYNESNDPAWSWLRINPSTRTALKLSPSVTDATWNKPIGNYSLTLPYLGQDAVPANTGLGYQFAQFVIDDGATFALTGKVGGSTGTGSLAAFDYAHFIANLPPAISGGGTVTSSPAPAGASGSLSTRRIVASDADGIIKAFALSDLDHAATAGFDLTKVDATTFDLTWNAATVAAGTYHFALSATDSSVQSNNTTATTLAITVVPEPATLLVSAVVGCATLARMRRRAD